MGQHRTAPVHAARCMTVGVCALLVCALSAQISQASAQTARGGTLRIASWNLTHLSNEEAQKLRKAQKPPQRAWRNTFGAERRTADWRRRGLHGIDADIIALQGVTSIQDVRRIFPAKVYHLVVSRAALSELHGNVTSRAQAGSAGFTAIAVRRRRGLRVAGQRHFTVPAIGPALLSNTLPGLALRLSVDRQPIWIASVQFRDTCKTKQSRQPAPQCDAERLMAAGVSEWIERTRVSGYAVIMTGHLEAGLVRGIERRQNPDPNAGDCAQVPPRITLLKPHDTTADGDMTLARQPPPNGRPCAALADLSPIGAPTSLR